MVEIVRVTVNKVDQLFESLKLADRYEQGDYDNWALAIRLSVADDVAKLPESEKKLFIARVRSGQ